ncbi:hypothetical protein ACLMJK_003688 [Lecanora helva]
MARAKGTVQEDDQPQIGGVSVTAVSSTFRRALLPPGFRHDNDEEDIAKISILPTEDEIRSDHPPFLPSMDMDQPHFIMEKVQRHLDTLFRLLRHDVFGELGEALGGLLVSIESDPTAFTRGTFNLNDIRAYYNPMAHISYVSFDQRRGLEAQISFQQPYNLRKATASQRRQWWEESKRMEEGILLCFVSMSGTKASMVFFTVSEKTTDPGKENSLSSDRCQATVTAKLATVTEHDLGLMTRLSCENVTGFLVEFPGVLLATFVPILENLQNMQRLSRLPFQQWILPETALYDSMRPDSLQVPPPLYARSPGFTFSLKSILKDTVDEIFIMSTDSPDSVDTIDQLEESTQLDRGQCSALVAALTREFAFIQGPPGTGKSFVGVQLMRVLLSCRKKANLGPILVVCYTNHALDQFLEHLVNDGIDQIIRIGGQSKSKVLEGKNLRVVSKSESRAKSEGYHLAKTYEAIEEQGKTIRKLLVDEDGFQMVGQAPFDHWMKHDLLNMNLGPESADLSFQATDQLLALANSGVYSVPLHQRQRLVNLWVEEIRSDATDNLFESVKEANKLQQELTKVHDEIDRRVLQTAEVIGVTTTGLARRIATLQHIKSKVVICEEAGEVMEPHIISALLPSVEHFVQIGDHEQLRPQINNYSLSLESQQGLTYQLDRSQFERLSVANAGRPALPLAQLNIQRRMRPVISTLIRESIYPRLTDHESTRDLPHVVGLRNNVYWLDHDNMEDEQQGDMHHKSHSNIWEVDMVHSLVRHILRQGIYNSTDIAVLTPYTGQLSKIRAKLRNDFEIVLSDRDQETLEKEGFGVAEHFGEGTRDNERVTTGPLPLQKKKMSELLRAATVDNFQGEEAKIVIVSLVRSNKQRKVGFLRTRNLSQYGLISKACCVEQNHWAIILPFVVHGIPILSWKPPNQTTLPDTVPREVADWLAIDGSLIVVIVVRPDVIHSACTRSLSAHNLANGC